MRSLLLVVALAFAAFGAAALAASGVSSREGADAKCGVDQLGIAPGPLVSEATGQNTLVMKLRNRGTAACSLRGYPRVSLVDARGALPFAISHRGDQMITSRRPRKVIVRPGGHAFAAINKYRCDLGDRRVPRRLNLWLPQAPQKRHLVLRIPRSYALGYCGRHDPGSTVAVSPFEPTLAATMQSHG